MWVGRWGLKKWWGRVVIRSLCGWENEMSRLHESRERRRRRKKTIAEYFQKLGRIKTWNIKASGGTRERKNPHIPTSDANTKHSLTLHFLWQEWLCVTITSATIRSVFWGSCLSRCCPERAVTAQDNVMMEISAGCGKPRWCPEDWNVGTSSPSRGECI